MPQTPREIVRRTLKFESPERIARQMWVLPGAARLFADDVAGIQRRYPDDIICPPNVYRPSLRAKGDIYTVGISVDEWGCIFENIQEGLFGEVKNPVIKDISDWRMCRPPYEMLPEDVTAAVDTVNRFCEQTDKFVIAGCCPRPWERMQFLRGSANAMMDIMTPETGARDLLRVIHEFYLKELEFWVQTDVDAISFMDDWGSQKGLLIRPGLWRQLFKPLYEDYCDSGHSSDKFVFMHSDGYIMEIYEELVEIGVDALNSQLFIMDMEELAQKVKGKITFWGEIDRQHILPSRDPQIVREAVQKMAGHLYDPRGGVIVQFEFGPEIYPPNAMIIYEEWEKIYQERCQR